MEPATVMQEMPWEQNLRSGQAKVVELFKKQNKVVAQLPTGYGKTLAATCSYLCLNNRIGINRMLYIVPRGAQAQQAAEEIPSTIKRLVGGEPRSHVVGDNPITALRAHRTGSSQIFVVTIQSLVTSDRTLMTVREMMQTGNWMIVADEHQHYGEKEDSAWTSKVTSLTSSAFLAMSATPDRADRASPFGKPDVVVKYVDAWRDGHVKELRLHSYEYRVDAININGDVIPFNTADLFKEVGSDNPVEIEKWMASKQMRWSPKYISPLVLHPIERIIDLKVKGIKAQMLVQAISCSHAKMVCEQVRSLVPAGMRVDWVGTGPNGRSDGENETTLQEFCPPKDANGKRNWSLDVLVNVGIAGEGLDTTDVCEVVFLTSPSINNSCLQTIGRGARTMKHVNEQPICTINVDGASDFAKHVGVAVMTVFDDGHLTDEEIKAAEQPESRQEGDYKELPDTISVGILDVTLVDIRKDPMYQRVLELTASKISSSGMSDEQAERFTEAAVHRSILEYMRDRDERFNASAVEAQKRDRITASVSKVAGLIVRRAASRSGMRIEKTFVGDVIKRINQQKKKTLGPIERAGEDELERHYKWIKQLEAQVLSGELPAWLQ